MQETFQIIETMINQYENDSFYRASMTIALYTSYAMSLICMGIGFLIGRKTRKRG